MANKNVTYEKYSKRFKNGYFSKNYKSRLAAGVSFPASTASVYDTLKLSQFAQHLKLKHFSNKKI